MFPAFERLIAFRYLRPNRSDRFVSVITGFSFLGIMLGVATLIVVMAVMNGFRQELFSKILGIGAHVSVYAQNERGMPSPMDSDEKLLRQLIAVDGVVSAIPIVEGQALASKAGKNQGVMVRGMREKDFESNELFKSSIESGDLAQLTGIDSIMIGSKLARRMGVRAGDTITLISPQGQATPFGTVPRIKAFVVRAIFNVGMYEYDNGLVYLPMDAAQAFFNLDGTVSAIEMHVRDPFQMDQIKNKLFMMLPDRYNITDWQRTHSSFFNAIQVERNVMFLILTLIIVVAAFNIVSGLVMLVKDKSASIAILRTMGASRGAIMRIFFLSGASIGVVGTIFGLLLGIAFAENIESIRQFLQSLSGTELFSEEIYFLSRLPAEINWGEVVSVAAMSLGLSFLATIYPSWRAARMDPVEALRYE